MLDLYRFRDSNMHATLLQTAHREYPPPTRPWRMTQRWGDLLFAHWPVPAAELVARLPAGLEPDCFDGWAWLGVVPFSMSHIRVRTVGGRSITVPGAESFPELNLRTYVRPSRSLIGQKRAGGSLGARAGEGLPRIREAIRNSGEGHDVSGEGRDVYAGGDRHLRAGASRDAPTQESQRGGVYFFSLDAASLLAVVGARVLFGLPYFWAQMHSATQADGSIEYSSRRRLTRQPVNFAARYRSTGAVAEPSKPGSLAHFVSERYRLYTSRRGRVHVGEIHHRQWPLEPAEAEIERNDLPASFGFRLPPVLHFARSLDVHIWGLQ
jgi:uncharacterized protein YqjF (DUF2071 family)